VRWPCQGRIRAPNDAAVQAAVFPDARQASTGVTGGFHERGLMAPRIGLRVSGPPKAVGKNCDPTGVAAEQTSNIARGTPRRSAESRSISSTSLGVARLRGPRVRFAQADNETRRSARPSFRRDRQMDDGVPGAAKNTGDDARLRQTSSWPGLSRPSTP
jgi:hypothetical protein